MSNGKRINELHKEYLAAIHRRDATSALAILDAASHSATPDQQSVVRAPNLSIDFPDVSGYTALYRAAKEGQTLAVDSLLAQGANPNAGADEDGWSPLHIAITNAHDAAANSLLAAGARVSARTATGQTPLHAAAATDQPELVSRLLSLGADANARDEHGRRPLEVALSSAGDATVRMLLERGADPNSNDDGRTGPPLFIALAQNSIPRTRMLLDARADPCLRAPAHAVAAGATALHRAALADSVEATAALLAAGAGAAVNATDCDGETALHHAAAQGSYAITALLLGARADARVLDSRGRSPVHMASMTGARRLSTAHVNNTSVKAAGAGMTGDASVGGVAAAAGEVDDAVLRMLLRAARDSTALRERAEKKNRTEDTQRQAPHEGGNLRQSGDDYKYGRDE